jgi:hypothetical protein
MRRIELVFKAIAVLDYDPEAKWEDADVPFTWRDELNAQLVRDIESVKRFLNPGSLAYKVLKSLKLKGYENYSNY